MQREIKQTIVFKQPPEEVWEYLTRPELLEQWLMKADFQPRVGHRFSFANKAGKTTYCEVLEIIPHQLLVYSWKVKNTHNDIDVDSKVAWTLSKKDGGTELRLLHSGFMQTEDYNAHHTGWGVCLQRFEVLLKTNRS